MQGLFSMVNNASAIYVMRNSQGGNTLSYVELAGMSVWLVGFAMEVIADAELQAHRNDPAKQGTIITTGTWRYSRHPNYFGEAFLWWGIYLVSIGCGGLYTFYSALFITLLIRYVSGVAMLERKQKKKPAFRVYMQETNAFIPWFSKPFDDEKRPQMLALYTKMIEDESA